MRYCVGIVGRDADGREIRCNERFHSRCHLEGRSPNGSWFCPFCVDMLVSTNLNYENPFDESKLSYRSKVLMIFDCVRHQHVVEGDNEAYFHRSGRTRYVSRRSTSYVSGPSTRHGEMTERRKSPSCEPGPSRRLYEPNEQSLRRRRQTCVEEGGWETESETEASFNSSGSDESDGEDNESMRSATPSDSNSASEGGNDWSMIDDVVLCEEPQPGYSGNGFTTVSRSRKRRKRQGKKRSRKGKKRSRRTKKKKLPNVRQRLASIVGLNIRTGRVKRRRAMRRESSDEPRSETRNVDLLDTIMMEQAKVLAPSNCRALTRDGTVRETKLMAEYIKKVDESTSNQVNY
ncbi:unnamed protein product [Anisakis simplex]|uniref:PHD domain-containing protein n=1 Tax=Anisakis simplex TaxID=6269 RepID=A0A0M3JX86_ANISI|nr:unnamed protein product [Anisakis simplex]